MHLAATCLISLVPQGSDLGERKPVPPEIVNLGHVSYYHRLSDGIVAFSSYEPQQGADLNGDGDLLDSVLHVFHLRPGSIEAGAVQNVGIAVGPAAGYNTVDDQDLIVHGDWMPLRALESDQGLADFNGDGDASDEVLFLYDVRTSELVNTGYAARGVLFEGERLLFSLNEEQQGQEDFNGDGDGSDYVLHVLEVGTDELENVGVAVSSSPPLGFQIVQDTVAMRVPESSQGATDLNGDGDAFDWIPRLLDLSTGEQLSLDVAASPFTLGKDALVVNVSEQSQGGIDINGDGDAEDLIASLYPLDGGAPTSLMTQAIEVESDGGLLAFSGLESDLMFDVNGDGDQADRVPRVLFGDTGEVLDLPFATGYGVQISDGVVAFLVSEEGQGMTDLNGDGKVSGSVLHLVDLETHQVRVLRTHDPRFSLEGDGVLFSVAEFEAGVDLNGDGDFQDYVVHLHRISDRSTRNFGLAVDASGGFARLEHGLVMIGVSEEFQGGVDLNGDGNALGKILHTMELSTGELFDHGLGLGQDFGDWTQVSDEALVFQAVESPGNDLNGDGDNADRVLHVLLR